MSARVAQSAPQVQTPKRASTSPRPPTLQLKNAEGGVDEGMVRSADILKLECLTLRARSVPPLFGIEVTSLDQRGAYRPLIEGGVRGALCDLYAKLTVRKL